MSMVTNALTVDVEDWFQGIELDHRTWGSYEPRLRVGLERLLALLDRHDVRATFFVLGSAALRQPDVVREIAAAGHEIGTHGMTHRFCYDLEPGEFAKEVRTSIGVLEDLSARRVIGHRAPFFSITRRAWWAFDVLAGAGIKYDSSVFPVRNYRYGVPDAPRFPFEVETSKGTIAEFPISTLRLRRVNVPFSGGFYLRFWPYRFIEWAVRRLNDRGRPAVVYVHPWEVDPDHPRLPLPRRVGLTHYHRLGTTAPKLGGLLRRFQFAPMEEVLFAAGVERSG